MLITCTTSEHKAGTLVMQITNVLRASPLAIIIDDHVKVWVQEERSQVLQIKPFKHHSTAASSNTSVKHRGYQVVKRTIQRLQQLRQLQRQNWHVLNQVTVELANRGIPNAFLCTALQRCMGANAHMSASRRSFRQHALPQACTQQCVAFLCAVCRLALDSGCFCFIAQTKHHISGLLP